MSMSITRISPATTWKNQTQLLTGLPKSQHVWTSAERSTVALYRDEFILIEHRGHRPDNADGREVKFCRIRRPIG